MANKWKYRVKSEYHRAGMSRDWQSIEVEKIESVKNMRPGMFEFIEVKPPTPTSSMEVDNDEPKIIKMAKEALGITPDIIAKDVLKKSNPKRKKKARKKSKTKDINK